MEVLTGKSSINGPFSMAILNGRINQHNINRAPSCNTSVDLHWYHRDKKWQSASRNWNVTEFHQENGASANIFWGDPKMIEAPVLVIKRIYIYIFYYTNTYIYIFYSILHSYSDICIYICIYRVIAWYILRLEKNDLFLTKTFFLKMDWKKPIQRATNVTLWFFNVANWEIIIL